MDHLSSVGRTGHLLGSTFSDFSFVLVDDMGRRAKNKQGEPAPLRNPDTANTKKSGKRKAEDDGPKRSPKKLKAGFGSVVAKDSDKKGKGGGREKGKAKVKAGKARGKENVREGSLGWEDVDDGDLEAHAACVWSLSLEC